MQRGQAGGGGQDNSYDLLWGMALVFAVIIITWYFGKNYIADAIYQLKRYEIIGIEYVINHWNALMMRLNLPNVLIIQTNDLKEWLRLMGDGSAGAEYKMLVGVLTDVGKYLRYVAALILLIFAYIVYSKNVVLKFKTVFTMKTMRQSEQQDWPQITPVLSLNLAKEDIDKGPWAMAMSPMQFGKKYNLLKEKTGNDGKPAVDLIRSEAYQIFVMQLGPHWTGFQALPVYARALFAVFAACANNDREAAFKLLKQISSSARDTGKLNFEGADVLLVKYYNSKVVVKVVQKHAYVLTIMASMLELARTDGVFASSEFLWLKPVDRRLWYMLNTVGRQTAVPEISGPYAHWLAEKKWGTGLRTPMVEEAVKALELALADILYEPEDKD